MTKRPLQWLAGDNRPNALGYTAIDPARGQTLRDWYHSPAARRERELAERRYRAKKPAGVCSKCFAEGKGWDSPTEDGKCYSCHGVI
jgi:hypothetical protein